MSDGIHESKPHGEKRGRRMAIHSGTALSLHLKAVTLISGTRILLLLCKAYFYALPRSGGAEHKIPWDFRCGCSAPWKGENRSPLRHFRIPPPRVCMLRIIRVMSDVGWGGTLRIHIPQLCCLIDSKEEVVSSNASKRL